MYYILALNIVWSGNKYFFKRRLRWLLTSLSKVAPLKKHHEEIVNFFRFDGIFLLYEMRTIRAKSHDHRSCGSETRIRGGEHPDRRT